MIGWIVLGYGIVPNLFNLIIILHKRKKTINSICKNLEENGYIVDQRFKNSITKAIIEASGEKYEESDYYYDLCVTTWCPFFRWFGVYFNIEFLRGDYTGLNKVYAYLEDSASDEDVTNYLEEKSLIKIDKEKIKWLSDKNNALKELEKKDDQVNVDSEIHTFSNDDKLDELYAKRAEIEEIIQRKESNEQKINEDVRVLGLKKKKQK